MFMKENVKYRFTPSLLNSFQRYLDSDIDADDFMNIDRETGEQRLTADEIAASRERELLDSINHVESVPSESADKGTCFNEIIDCMLLNRKSTRDDVQIDVVYVDEKGNTFGQPNAPEATGETVKALRAKMDDFVFLYDIETCKQVAAYFAGSVPQQYCSAVISTCYGDVELYGYIDYIQRDMVKDMKTTTRYAFGKYENGWQKDVYPYCLIESGDMPDVSAFEYTVYVWSGGSSRTPLLTAKQYKEEYTYNHAKTTARLRQMCERFIEWVELHRDEITYKKLLGE